MKRKSVIAFGLAANIVAAAAGPIRGIDDLANTGMLAQGEPVPIMIAFVRKGCDYCEVVMKQFLEPMNSNREYRRKVLFRQVDVESDREFRDFSGKLTTYRNFARSVGVNLTPTVKVFDTLGHELAGPIVGLSTLDYYGARLDQAIDEAGKAMHDGRWSNELTMIHKCSSRR